MKLSKEVYDKIGKEISNKIDENNRCVYQNFSFELEIEDDGEGNCLFIRGYMNIILYFSKKECGEYCGPYGGEIINVVPVWWDMMVSKWDDESEEWDDSVECDIEWSEIRKRLIEE